MNPERRELRQPTPQQIDRLIQTALEEDLGDGDVTTDGIFRESRQAEASAVAKEPLVLCGIEIFQAAFKRLDPNAIFPSIDYRDGDDVPRGETMIVVRGDCASLLKAERTALNILQRLSGIATLTRKFVEAAKPAVVLDTRKTTPGLRVFEKYAVRCGGGCNHRFGLFDAVLIKDNHIQAAGSITEAVARVRQNAKTGSIEVETRTLQEVQEALRANVDRIMLDNMDDATVKEAVKRVGGRAKIEVSGSVDLQRLGELSKTGVDYVSVGALTHSARAVDISLNFL
ncbi:MAG: carboxylating nicotinate-nucleotide diphosphorylase [Nitrospinae bacterium]|nr:carboxylating nicotinate-nucleotide diphosphorylase [Nitrospinota bacterium]